MTKWFLVWYDDMWHKVGVRRHHRKFQFIDEHDISRSRLDALNSVGRAYLQKYTTLRLLHDFKWFEYPPGHWKFGGDWN